MEDSSKYTVDYPVAGIAMELGYRFTVAVNILKYKLESWGWLDKWCSYIRDALNELFLLTDPERIGQPRIGVDTKTLVVAHESVAGSPLTWISTSSDCDEQSAIRAIVLALDDTRKNLCLSFDDSGCFDSEGNPLVDYFIAGERIALFDLRRSGNLINKSTFIFRASPQNQRMDKNVFRGIKQIPVFAPLMKLMTIVDKQALTTLLRDAAESRMPKLMNARNGDSEIVDDATSTKQRVIRQERAPFSVSGHMRMFLSLLHPRYAPSLVWMLPASTKMKYMLVYTGRHFGGNGIIRFDKKSHLTAISLLYSMQTGKAAGVPPEDCGWVDRNVLYRGRHSDAITHAWGEVKKLTQPMGDVEFIKYNAGDSHQRRWRGQCRLPGKLASADCIVLLPKK